MSADDRHEHREAPELIRWLARLFRKPEDIPIKGVRERVLPYTMGSGPPRNRQLVA